MDQLPHISEETAAMNKSMGTGGPDLQQGTPVGEVRIFKRAFIRFSRANNRDDQVLKNDAEAKKNLPKVMRDAMNKQQGGTRSFSTSARQLSVTMPLPQVDANDPNFDFNAALRARRGRGHGPSMQKARPERREDQDYPGQWYDINEEEADKIARGEMKSPEAGRAQAQLMAQLEQGLKFDEPTTPRLRQRHLRRRYDGIITQVTNMIMRHGMKARAQKVFPLSLD